MIKKRLPRNGAKSNNVLDHPTKQMNKTATTMS